MLRKKSVVFSLLVIVGTLVFVVKWVSNVASDLPAVSLLNSCITTTLNEFELCPESTTYTSIDQISEALKKSVVVSEDASFFIHSGFDWDEIKQSLKKNWKQRRFVRGGSTISQQLIKNVFLTSEKTLSRKIKEAYLTILLEREFTKNQILEKYLNVAEFGPNIYGIHEASGYYFGKKPERLNLLESAFLAFLLPNPKLHHLNFERGQLTEFARKRVLSICGNLLKYKKISEATYVWAKDNVDEFPWYDVDQPFQTASSKLFYGQSVDRPSLLRR